MTDITFPIIISSQGALGYFEDESALKCSATAFANGYYHKMIIIDSNCNKYIVTQVKLFDDKKLSLIDMLLNRIVKVSISTELICKMSLSEVKNLIYTVDKRDITAEMRLQIMKSTTIESVVKIIKDKFY